jgi:hypothetical protein
MMSGDVAKGKKCVVGADAAIGDCWEERSELAMTSSGIFLQDCCETIATEKTMQPSLAVVCLIRRE